MVNYQLGKIYKIVDNTNGNIYIGSTCEPTLSRRLAQHKATYNQYVKGNSTFVTSFEILKNGSYEIVLIESYPCNSKDELHSREKFYIENNTCVNKYIPTRTKNEYYEANKEQIREYQKQYNETNKEHRQEYYRQYNEQNKGRIQEYYKQWYEENKERLREYQKQYNETNKEHRQGYLKQYNETQEYQEKGKQYYETNKQKILEKWKQPHTCDCGSVVRIGDKTKTSTIFRTKNGVNCFNIIDYIILRWSSVNVATKQ